MFEKYHLLHVNVNRNLTTNSMTALLSSVSVEIPPVADIANEEYNETFFYGNSDFTRFCITGSFDFLLPFIAKSNFFPKKEPVLFIQSFCLMNNTREYFTRSKDYESILLSYTYSGSGRLKYGGKEYAILPEHGFLIDCHEPHEYFTSADNWEHLDIHIGGPKANDIYQYFKQQDSVTFSQSKIKFNTMIEELLDSYVTFSEFRDTYIETELSNILCALLKQAESTGTSHIPETYKYIVHYMECNYMRALSLDELAAMCNVSKYHFCREFKKYTSHTPNDYLIMLRMQHACILLINSDFSIGQVALEAGIENMSNFIYLFKKRMGMTPSTFRAKYRP